jgi:hypothetical protein
VLRAFERLAIFGRCCKQVSAGRRNQNQLDYPMISTRIWKNWSKWAPAISIAWRPFPNERGPPHGGSIRQNLPPRARTKRVGETPALRRQRSQVSNLVGRANQINYLSKIARRCTKVKLTTNSPAKRVHWRVIGGNSVRGQTPCECRSAPRKTTERIHSRTIPLPDMRRSLDHLVGRNQKRVWDDQAAARALIRAAHAAETQGFGLAGIDRVQVSETKVSFRQVTRASKPNHDRIITNPAATPTASAA